MKVPGNTRDKPTLEMYNIATLCMSRLASMGKYL